MKKVILGLDITLTKKVNNHGILIAINLYQLPNNIGFGVMDVFSRSESPTSFNLKGRFIRPRLIPNKNY